MGVIFGRLVASEFAPSLLSLSGTFLNFLELWDSYLSIYLSICVGSGLGGQDWGCGVFMKWNESGWIDLSLWSGIEFGENKVRNGNISTDLTKGKQSKGEERYMITCMK